MTVLVRGEAMRVRPHQILVWLSIGIQDMPHWDARQPHLPGILDTGNNHNFSIGRSHLTRWAGIQPELLERRGTIRDRGLVLPLHAAALWLHCNHPGREQPRTDRDPFPLHLPEGIAIYPDEHAPRLPVLGLRALTTNRLHLVLDGPQRLVWLRTSDWRDGVMRWLSRGRQRGT